MAEFLEERQRTQRRDPLAPCNTPLQDVASAVNSEVIHDKLQHTLSCFSYTIIPLLLIVCCLLPPLCPLRVAWVIFRKEQKAHSYKYFHAYNSGCNGKLHQPSLLACNLPLCFFLMVEMWSWRVLTMPGIVILRLSDKEICPVEFMSWVMERLRHERSQSFIGKKTRW